MSLTSIVKEKTDEVVREAAIVEARLEQANKEIARLRDQLRDVFGAVYIRLDGSVKQGTVYADASGGPMREVREAYLAPVRAEYWDRYPRFLEPSHTRRFRLMGQVGSMYVYGEV